MSGGGTCICQGCGQVCEHARRGRCWSCYYLLVPRKRGPEKRRNRTRRKTGTIWCQGCGQQRREVHGGLCSTCYHYGPPGHGRGRHKHTIFMDRPLLHVMGPGGLELATLINPHAEAAERARRVEVYRQQAEERPGAALDTNDARLRNS